MRISGLMKFHKNSKKEYRVGWFFLLLVGCLEIVGVIAMKQFALTSHKIFFLTLIIATSIALKAVANSPAKKRAYFSISLITRAGFPATITPLDTSFVTTAPAPIILPSPTLTPAQIVAATPIHTRAPILMGLQ